MTQSGLLSQIRSPSIPSDCLCGPLRFALMNSAVLLFFITRLLHKALLRFGLASYLTSLLTGTAI
jgi:hypothetical protein